MQQLNDLLDRLPVSRGFLLILVIVVLVFYQLNQPVRDSERALASMQNAIEARKHQVNESLARLDIPDQGLSTCIVRAARERAEIHPMSSGGIDDVSELEILQCAGHRIVSLAGLGQLVGLRYLDISDNNIQSLSPLSNHRDLKSLRVMDNPLEGIAVVRSLPALRELYMPDMPDTACGEIEKLVQGLKSNFRSIRCAGRSRGARESSGSTGGFDLPAPSRKANADRLTPAQQQELLEYERETR